jgi:hypothetical protein
VRAATGNASFSSFVKKALTIEMRSSAILALPVGAL